MKKNDPHSENWKVVYVTPRAEKKVAKRLTELGIENYLPINKEKRKWSDRMKWVELPMISGYVFVRPKPIERDVLLQINAILNYVRYNGADAVIREEEIKALKSIEEKGYYVESVQHSIKSGDAVFIAHGPFTGLKGTVTLEHSEMLCTVMIDSMDISLKIKVPAEVLKQLN